MKLPLSEADRLEIQLAYNQAMMAAKECAQCFSHLIDTLEQRTACIDDKSAKLLSSATGSVQSDIFKLRIAKWKLKYSLIEGREFSQNS